MTPVRTLAAMAFIAVLAGCASVPETSSRFNFSPSYAPLSGID